MTLPPSCCVARGQTRTYYCDEMLARLGRWLRAAGYDTLIAAAGTRDRDMIETALGQGRCLLTRDRKLTEFRHADRTVVVLQANQLDEGVVELSHRLHIDWLYRPFARCMVCNTPLDTADTTDWSRVPARSRSHVTQLWKCRDCNKVYWDGSHSKRMRAKLEQWARLDAP